MYPLVSKTPQSASNREIHGAGDPARLADSMALASYLGMIWRIFQWKATRLGGLIKQGNPLRFPWSEAVIHAVMAGRLAREFSAEVTLKAKRPRRL